MRTARALLILISIWLHACGSATQVSPPRPVRLIVSRAGGVDYQTLAEEYGRTVPSIELRPYETTSALLALEAINDGHADIGFSTADLSYLAFSGRLEAQPRRLDRLRAIFASGILPLHVVARDSSGIESVSDLKGRAVAIGAPGSAIERAAHAVLNAFGIPLASIRARSLPSMAAVTQLRSGALDAMFVIGGFPGPSPAAAAHEALERGARLLPIKGGPASYLRETNRYFRSAIIPAGTYPHQTEAIPTVGIHNILICREDLDEELVYDLTAGFFDVMSRSTLAHAFRFLDIDQTAATYIPLHDGASRYYRERELFQ